MKRANVLVTLSACLLALASCKKDVQSTITGNAVAGSDNSSAALSEESNGQGAVYLIDNAPGGNHVLAYARSTNGQLSGVGSFSTGGTGTGTGLGSQGAVILDESGQYLFAVNAGSNEISSFKVKGNALTLVDKIGSGGTRPVSLTLHGDVLYVLNAGDEGNIHGFRVNQGDLADISGSGQPLSTVAPGPAEVQFNHTGTALVVTEKSTNTIDVFPVVNGVAGAAKSFAAVGVTPFGFAVGKNDQVFVSNAYGGMTGLSALTSFSLNKMTELALISGPVGTKQTSACWVAVTNNGQYVYTANTGSATISGFAIDNEGDVTLLNPGGVSGTTGGGPADMAISNNAHFLYSRNGPDNSISMFEIQSSGNLTNIGTITGLPAGSVGLAAK